MNQPSLQADSTPVKVAIIAPPWIQVPPHGYGGIEAVIHGLVRHLPAHDVEVTLYSVGTSGHADSRLDVRWLFEHGQYDHIAKQVYDTMAVPIAHVLHAFRDIANDGTFDLVHDHNALIGPAVGVFMDPMRFPPILHTLHGPFTPLEAVALGQPDNRLPLEPLKDAGRCSINCISAAQRASGAAWMQPGIVPVIHNGVELDAFPDAAAGTGPALCLGRICADKGQHLAAAACRQIGMPLVLAGAVGSFRTPEQVAQVIAEAGRSTTTDADVAYFVDQVVPHLDSDAVEYVGELAGRAKLDALLAARVLVMAIDWEEPFGMVVIEALACGTPVVAMRRGAMPELIEHGVTGFLADDLDEFTSYLRRVDEIDPQACRASVARRFSAGRMAEQYAGLYRELVRRDAPAQWFRPRGHGQNVVGHPTH